MYFVASVTALHQSVKKAGVGVPHVSLDAGVDQLDGDTIVEDVEQPSIVGASLIISCLIIVPLTIVVAVTACTRLHKQGD